LSLFVALIFDSTSLQSNVLPRRVTASWCQRILPLSSALPPRSTSAARHNYYHGASHRLRVAAEVRSEASCSRTAYTSTYTFAVGSDHPPSPHILRPCRCLLNPDFSARNRGRRGCTAGKPPLRGRAASLGPSSRAFGEGAADGNACFAASSPGGAAREQHAAMEAGGGAVAAPPKRGQLKDRPAAGRRGRKSVRAFWARFPF
jgi:hypothetical protein